MNINPDRFADISPGDCVLQSPGDITRIMGQFENQLQRGIDLTLTDIAASAGQRVLGGTRVTFKIDNERLPKVTVTGPDCDCYVLTRSADGKGLLAQVVDESQTAWSIGPDGIKVMYDSEIDGCSPLGTQPTVGIAKKAERALAGIALLLSTD